MSIECGCISSDSRQCARDRSLTAASCYCHCHSKNVGTFKNVEAAEPVLNRWGCPIVQGRCPSCGLLSLFLGSGGFVTCSNLNCKGPGDASDLLLYGKTGVTRMTRLCAHGHSERTVGCVSCVLLFATADASIDQPNGTSGGALAGDGSSTT